jgi:hypothetical protein
MYGNISSETLRSFTSELNATVSAAANEAVAKVCAKYGFPTEAVLVLGAGSPQSEEAEQAIETLKTIRSLVN